MAIEQLFTESEARDLTERIKKRAHELWVLLLEAYERKAWKALGYTSWGSYYANEFHETGRRGYQLLDAARVLEELEHAGFRNPEDPGSPLLNEGAARELAPILRGGQDEIAEIYREAIDRHGPKPTAKQIRNVVNEHLEPAPEPEPAPGSVEAWRKRVEIYVAELEIAAKFCDEHDLDEHWPEIESLWRQVCATRPGRTDAG